MMHPLRMLWIGLALGLAVAPRGASADEAAPSLTGLRTWANPSGSRVVFDFASPVTPVAPDSGDSRDLVIALPGAGFSIAPSVATRLSVRDGSVDSVAILADSSGGRLVLRLADSTSFRVSQLAAVEDKPFRIVVDVQRSGAAAAEERRLAAIAAAKKKERTRVIAIDAGHGGEDTGARGPGGVYEKHVTLGIAQRLADEINKIPGLRALLTRDGDYFIPLRQRYQIAEKARSDLFISIHCNSSKRRGAGSGSEVFFLSLKGANDQSAQDLADLENAADLVGGVPAQAEDQLVEVLYEFKRSGALQRSQLLAETLLDHVAEDRRLSSRGIKQAGFVVLKSVDFPSVLVETAFINNPREVLLLKSPEFQTQMAKQLATGVKQYFALAGIPLGADSARGSAGASTGR